MEENMDKELEKQSQEVIKKPEKRGLLGRVVRWGAALGIAGTTAAASLPTPEASAQIQSPAPIVQPESQKTPGFEIVSGSVSAQISQELTNKFFPTQELQAETINITNPLFAEAWNKTDMPIATGQVTNRSWIWGDQIIFQGNENGKDIAVFDKGIMEKNPDQNAQYPWTITPRLCAKELVTGITDNGENLGSSKQSIAGDPGSGPTYETFSKHLNDGPLNDGQIITQQINIDGSVVDNPALAGRNVKAGMYIPQTNHRIADAFLPFMQEVSGDTYNNFIFATGLPITEPYWVRAKVAGVDKDILVQAFERRVLTYTPNNQDPWKIEMGNAGRHYYEWTHRGGEIPGAEEKIDGNDWSIINVKGAAVSIKLKDGDNSKRILNEQVTPLLNGKKFDLRLTSTKQYAQDKWGANPSYWYDFKLPNDQGSEVYGGQTNTQGNMIAIWVYSPDAIKSIYAKHTLFRQALYATFDFKPSDLQNMELRKLISQISQILGDNTELIVNR